MDKKTRPSHRLSRFRSSSRSQSPASAAGRSRSKTASVSGLASASKPRTAQADPGAALVEAEAEGGGGEEEKLQGEDIYQAEGIIGKQVRRGRVLYRVKWLGYPVSQSTWEPLENIGHCSEFIDEFNRRAALQQRGQRRRRGAREDETPEEEDSDEEQRPARRRSAQRKRLGSAQPKHPSRSPSPAPASPEPEDTFGAPGAHRSPNKRPRVLSSSSPSPPPSRSLTPKQPNKNEENDKSEQKLETGRDHTVAEEKVVAKESGAVEEAAVGPVDSPADRGDSLLREEPVDSSMARDGADSEGPAPAPAPAEEEVSRARDAACAADLDDTFDYWRPFPLNDVAADSEQARSTTVRLAEHLKLWQSKAVAVVGIQFGPQPLPSPVSAASAKAFVHFRFATPDAAIGVVPEAPGRDILQSFPLALVRQYLPDKLACFYQSCAYLVPDAPRHPAPAETH